MTDWIFKGHPVTKVEDLAYYGNIIGFVYKITHVPTGKFYIGKKSLNSSRKTKISNREKVTTGTRKRTKTVVKSSNWLNYWGSCKELTEERKKEPAYNYRREIIELCCTKKYLNYCELSYQIKHNVLIGNSYNGNILGRYFARDMENCG